MPPQAVARTARAALGLALGVVLSELLLRGAGAAWLARFERGPSADPDAELVVACVGDSNVYGLQVGERESYPARLQALLDPDGSGAAQVWNLGVPGHTTLHALLDLQDLVARSAPDVIVWTAGVNNAWAWVGGDDAVDPTREPWFERWRLARLVRIAAQRHGVLDAPGTDAPAEASRLERGDRLDRTARLASIRRDLERAHAVADGAGAAFVLATYVGNELAYRDANDAMVAYAREADCPLIDVRPAAARLIEELGTSAVLLPDQHPRAPGYELVARLVLGGLVERGLVEGDVDDDPTAGIRAIDSPSLEVAVHADAAAVQLELTRGTPGAAVRLVLFGAHRDEPDAPPVGGLGQDPLVALSRRAGLTATLDAQGTCRIPLPTGRLARTHGDPAGLGLWILVYFDERNAEGRYDAPAGPFRIVLPD